GYFQAHANLAAAYTGLGRDNDAINVYLEVIKSNPESHIAYYNLGFLYLKQGKDGLAIESLARAVKLNPELLKIMPESELKHIIKAKVKMLKNFPSDPTSQKPDSTSAIPSTPALKATKASSSGTSDNALSQEEEFYRNIVQEAADFIIGHREALKEEDLHVSCEGILLEVKRRLKREGMSRRGQPINAEVFVWIEERDYHTYLVVIEGGYILDYELVDPEDLSQGGRPIVLPFASAEENIYRGKHWRQILDPKDQSFLWNILQNEDRWNDVAQRLENEDRTAPGGHATESEDPGRSASAGRESEPKLHLEWKTIIAAPIIAGLIVTPLFIAGVIPVSFAYFFAFIDIAITAFSVWMHEKGYLKGRKNAFDGLAQEAKARLLQNQRLSLRAFALGLLLFSPMLIYIPIYLSAPSFATTIPLWFMSLTENLAYISVLCGMAAVINFLLWFLPAFSGKEGLIAGELMSEEEEKDLIGEIKKLYREDGEVVAAIDKAVAEGVDIQARLYKGEPIWIYGMAKRYNAEEDRLVNDADSMRMEFHDKPLVVETEDDPMSRYHYISSESQLAAEIEDENSRAYELDMGTRQKGERRFHIYRLEDQKEETAEKQRASLLETVPRVKGIASVRRGTMDVDGKHHRGIIVDVVSSKDEDMHLRVDEILGENPRDLFIERSNAENRLMRYALNYLFALRSLLFEWIMFLNDVALGVRKEWLKKDTRLVYRIVRVMFVLLSELSKGKHDNRILVRKRNVNDYTLECLYDHHKIAEDEDWVVLEKEKRSKIPVNMEKYKAFRNIVKNSRLYKNMIISDFSSAAISGVLLAILLPAILETAQGFGVLAIGLLAITALTNITLIFGFLWSGTRIRTMEEPLSKIETVKARGGGIGDAIKQQVNIRLRRYHGAWGVLVILVSRILYLLLYPLFFIYLWHIWPAAPLGLIITLFLSMYIIWQVIEPIAVSFDWSNVFLIGEHGTGRSHFSDVRKKGLAEKFWRAEAFRSNLINIITLLTLLVTLLLKHKLPMIDIAITENLKVAVVDSWLFWAIFIPIGIILRPGLRILTLLYGEDSDSKLIIHSDPNNTVKKIAYFASENRYEYRFKFEDCGITLRSENPYFRPERIRDYRLKNLYGIPLRIAEVLDKFIPSRLISRKKVSFTERVQKGFFRVEEPYVIVDPDRLGIRMELDNAVKLVSPIEGEKHPSWMPVKKSWRFDDNGTTRAEIRQYAFDGHIDINSEDNRVGISSEKAKEDEELHRRNVVKFVDGKLIQEAKDNPLIDMGEEQGRRTRTHAVNTLLKGGVVYIHGDPVVYNSQRGNIHSDLEGHRKDLEERPLFIPNSPPEALRKYSFDLLGVRIEDGVREETFAVYHYVKPEEIPDEGYVEGVRVDDSMIRVSYYKSRIPGRIRKARIAKVERIKASSAGEKIELPIERTIRDYDVDIILIEQGLAAEGAEEALPGFSKAADNSVTEYLSADSKDKGFDSFKRAKLSTLDRVLLWRTAQRAPDQEAKNLKYAETASMLYQLAYGILLVVVGLVFSRMGELDFEALNISQFITSPLLILTTVMFLPWISERIDKIAKMQVSQRASQKSRGDLGIDRRYTSFNILKRQMGWAAIIILFSGLLFTFQLTPLFSGFTLLFGISPGVAFVFLQLAFVYTISVHSTIEDKTWWKLLEDLVRNNPRLIRKGYQRWFFDYLGTGVKIVFSCLVVSIVFFFFYYSFGLINSAFTIITAEFGTTTLGYILAAIALPVFSLSHFIFPLYARFGGDSKLVLEEPDSNFIIKKEEWKKSTNGSNGNGKTFIRRLFKFSSGRTISTTNPRSLPFLSESESDRYTKRFVMLDPDKQGVTLHGGGIETFNSRVNAIRGFFIRLFSPIKRLRIYKNRRGKLILYDYRETEKPSAKSPIRKGAEDNAATGESKPIEDAKPSSAGHTESEPKANVVLPMSPELLSNALFPDVAEKIGESLRPTSDKGGLPGDEELFQDDAGDLVLQRAAPLRSSVRHIVAIDNAA
ncbi:MAG: tetratricopeptide repeat protein, partial [Candidatus Omnitrophica bacterium]|nr:tetratricopeptide repeat protein [Candidatus Omnitrophota bacterium]